MTFDVGPFGHHSTASAILLVVGAVTVLNVLFQITRVVLSTFILPGTSVRLLTHTYALFADCSS